MFDPALTDVAGAGVLARSVPTQLADLDGDRNAELIVRTGCGLEVYDMEGAVVPMRLSADLADLASAGVPFVNISDLDPSWRSDRRLNDSVIANRERQLRERGWQGRVRIRVRDMSVMNGHALIAAAERLGVTRIPVVRQEHASEDARLYARAGR